MARLNYRHLEYFWHVAREGGVTAASRILYVGQPAISAQIRKLEQALGELRSSWKPFDASVYQPFDQGRNGANKLRRQVVAGLNDLLSQYDISPEELAP